MIFEEKWISSGQIRAIKQIKKEGRTTSTFPGPDSKLGGYNFYRFLLHPLLPQLQCNANMKSGNHPTWNQFPESWAVRV